MQMARYMTKKVLSTEWDVESDADGEVYDAKGAKWSLFKNTI
jgi:hypothetical protein